MKDKQYYIETVVQKFRNGNDELEALLYLQEEGLDEAIYKEILEAALSQKQEERLPHLAKKNMGLFILWIALTAFILFFDFFILPDASRLDNKFIFCLLGTIALGFCSGMSIAYYNTWKIDFLKKHSDFKINFQIIFITLMIPAFVVFFLISWRFSSVVDQSLAKDMIKTKGTIVSGYSVGGRRGDLISQVTVRFKTREGKRITTTEDIGSYAFKNFYEGQEVDMVYSKSNPENIDLLTSESEIKYLTNSQERDINPTDLIELMNIAPADIEAHLDKITFGWKQDDESGAWINEKKQLGIKVSSKNVILTALQGVGLIFPRRLKDLGFKALEATPSQPYSLKPQVFENDSHLVSIQYKNIENTIICIIEVAKK